MMLGKSDDRSTRSAGKPRTWGRVSGKISFRGETSMGPTKPKESTATKLMKIAQLSRENPNSEFQWLMPHYNFDSLMGCFNDLDGRKAVGADGIGKAEYGNAVAANITTLIEKMKSMSYRPGPVREVLIPKEGRPGATRPLGISNFEDKLVQHMTNKILGAIYEPTFRECSFGFRPNRSCHTAIKALSTHLFKSRCKVVIDVDLKNFFGTIDHDKLVEMLRMRIKDEVFIRYIVRMLKAGVLSDGDLRITEEGSPQGNVASPTLSNIFGHYVIDCWFEEIVKKHTVKPVALFRYCDDLVICCDDEQDAERIMRALNERLKKFSLVLNLEKTKMVGFDKHAFGNGVNQGSFDFLGFTFFLAHSRGGGVTVKLKTSRLRLRSKLGNVTAWMKSNRHSLRLKSLWLKFTSKLAGHVRYFGVSFNSASVGQFLRGARRIFFKWINRRSQKRSITWEKFALFIKQYPLPKVKVYHPLF